MDLDKKFTVDEDTYLELVRVLQHQGIPAPGRGVRSRDPEEICAWVDELNTLLPCFHETCRTSQVLSTARAEVNKIIKEDQEAIRNLLFCLDLPVVNLNGGDTLELKAPASSGKPKLEDVMSKVLEFMEHEGVILSREPGDSNEAVLNMLTEECKPVSKTPRNDLIQSLSFSNEDDEERALEEKKVKYSMKRKPTQEAIVELLRRLNGDQ
mgnify:CR=1 FL=1